MNPNIEVIERLHLDAIPNGSLKKYWLHIATNGIGRPIYVPVMVAKGAEPGTTLGLTAAIHGNEINGMAIVQRLFREIDVHKIRGTIVGVPVANVVSLLRNERRFMDGTDLNHIMPGVANGNVSEVYAHRFFNRIVKHFDYLVDLHTASFGRINSYYIRADMEHPETYKMAILQNADIIVHNPPSDGTLRGAAEEAGIHAITLELGDPNKFQRDMILAGYTGVRNLMAHLNMTDDQIVESEEPAIICQSSQWMFTDTGGVLRVMPDVTDMVEENQLVATLSNIFGDAAQSYHAPKRGVVIGKETYPIAQTGERILHLGILKDD